MKRIKLNKRTSSVGALVTRITMRKAKSEHRVKGSQYLTFMILPDPTKDAKTIKIPKWLRFPILALLVAIPLYGLQYAGYVANLEAQVAENKVQVVEGTMALSDQDETITVLQDTNSERYQDLVSLQEMAKDLGDRLSELEKYKDALNTKVSGTDIDTDTHKSLEVGTEEAQNLESLDFADAESAAYTVVEGQIIVENQDFDAQYEAIKADLEAALEIVGSQSDEFAALDEKVDDVIPYLNAYPNGYPVASHKVTCSFGYRANPFSGRGSELHTGTDFYAHYVDVHATGAGKVISAGWESGYGYMVVIDHGYGFVTKYAHNSKLYVSAGDYVQRGDVIAKSGNTGRSTGPHCHYEIWVNGNVADPMDYVGKGVN